MPGEKTDQWKEFEEYLSIDDHMGLMIRKRAQKYGDSRIAVRHKPYGEWISYTYREYGELVDTVARALIEWGAVEQKDFIGIFAQNRAEWVAVDFATYIIRGITVPIYATNSAKELEYIVNHAEIRFLFVGNQEQYDKAVSILPTAPSLEKIVVFDKTVKLDTASGKVMAFADFLKLGQAGKRDIDLQERIARTSRDDLATIIYTSGTTGEPKGVMLTHYNWFAMGFETNYSQPIDEGDVSLAILPLSHVFERGWTYQMLWSGGQVDFCHDIKALEHFLQESRPHYMVSVPRLWEKIHAKVKEDLRKASPIKQVLFNWSLRVGGQFNSLQRDQKPIPWGLTQKYKLADKVVLHKIRAVFGGRNKIFNVGGAAFSREIGEFFFNAGVLLLQGYGMTECFIISIANSQNNKFGTCGKVVPLVQVRLSEEGEIQAKNPSLMQGYYKKPELTREMYTEDGWFKTGDVGVIDDEGFVTITDRIKDLIKTSGGKYVAPQQIENLLKEDYYFEQVAVVGDGRQYVSALIVPSFLALEAYAENENITFKNREELVKDPRIIDFYQQRIDYRTRDLGQVEKVKKFTLLPREFTQEDGEITATLKVKRKVVNEKYRKQIDTMYN
ncbi:MAG: AMP-dependent synthetase/ligase [Methylocystaceae bacterium]